MIYRHKKTIRRGTALVEAALVYPVLLLFLMGTIVLGFGVTAFQEVASMAREGARWASVHGWNYNQTTGNAMATPATVYSNAILPHASGLDTSKLTYSVTWSDPNEKPTAANSIVTVTVNYQWYPMAYLSGPITITSTSVMPMSF